MPSVSQEQHNLMKMAASRRARRKMRKKRLPSLKVAREFVAADKASGIYGRMKRHKGSCK